MVSPFISPHEKAVLDYLILEHHTIIYIADNGFGDYTSNASVQVMLFRDRLEA